jgi:hypothetical protein
MESQFYQHFKKVSHDYLTLFRIENRAISGVPDVLATTKSGVFFTLEFKELSPKTNQVKLNKFQLVFHAKAINNPSFIIIRQNPLLKSEPKIYSIFHGSRAMNLATKKIDYDMAEIVTNKLDYPSLILPLIELVHGSRFMVADIVTNKQKIKND